VLDFGGDLYQHMDHG